MLTMFVTYHYFLGLRNLTVIDQCEKMIRQQDPSFRINKIPIDDPAIYDEIFSKADTQGVFQFESAGMKRVLTQLRPESIEDIIAVISLYRPGPMDSIPQYIKNRHNPKLVTYKHPLLEPILKVTYGCIVYQEQVMQICRELAGYSYGRADLVRRAMAKKKADVMAQERQYFIFGKRSEDGTVECPGAVANGVPEDVANAIFDEMTSFAAYAFNKSHAAAYAYVAYQTAYLKYHYKLAYMAALLTSVLENTDKVIEYINECSEQNIRVLPPDINISSVGFTVNQNALNFGLLAVKNLGRSAIEAIITERESNGRFVSLSDFLTRMQGKDLNRRAVESLIKSGAFDHFPHNRKEMLASYEGIMDSIADSARRNVAGQMDLFSFSSSESAPSAGEYMMPHLPDYSVQQRLSMEQEVTGLYLSGHPLDDYKMPKGAVNIISLVGEQANARDGENAVILCILRKKKVMSTKSKDQMAFLQVEDRTGSMEVIVFPNLFRQLSPILTADTVLLIKGRISLREEENASLICEQAAVYSPSAENLSQPGKLYLKFVSEKDPNLEKALTLIRGNPGNSLIYIHFSDTKKTLQLKNTGVSITESLLKRLKTLIGEQNIAQR